jgi:hypothetical protein
MVNSKENTTESVVNNDSTKKTPLPLLVSTGVIMFAGVVSCDVNVASQLNTVVANSITASSQDSQAEVEDQNEDDRNGRPKLKSYLRNVQGQLFYDSEAEDEEYYYRDWAIDYDDDDDDEYIFWS